MASPESRSHTPQRRRRPTVRIVKPRTSRTARYTFLITIATAAVLFFVWRFWQDDEPLLVARRSLEEFQLDWKCEAGHYFRAGGQAQPRACPRCRRPSYPVGTYLCTLHGEFEVAVRYKVRPDGVQEPSTFLLKGGAWGPAETTLVCPQCQGDLRRLRDNRFADETPQRKHRKKTRTNSGRD